MASKVFKGKRETNSLLCFICNKNLINGFIKGSKCPKCSTVFCSNCIINWVINVLPKCPSCRAKLKKSQFSETEPKISSQNVHKNEETQSNENQNVIFVNNLTNYINNEKLKSYFEDFGVIRKAKISTFDNGHSKGYGFVTFEKIEDAQKAIEQMNGYEIPGDKLFVALAVIKSSIDSDNDKTIFVKNIPSNISKESLHNLFNEIGLVKKVKIMKEDNGQVRGHAFITYYKNEHAQEAIDRMNGYELPAQKLMISFAQFNSNKGSIQLNNTNTTIFIKNVCETTNKEMLKDLFEEFGTIKNVKIVTDENGANKGHAFIKYEDCESAEKAIQHMNGRFYKNSKLFVTLAL